MGLALIFPGPPLPSEIGVQPPVLLSIPILGLCIQSAPYGCRSPHQVVPCAFCPRFLLLLPTLIFSGEGSSPHGEGLGCCQGAPLLLGTSSRGDPVGIERGTWFVKLAASRGHCLRPRGSIRRALGVKYHFQSRPGHQGGGGSKAEVAQGGLFRMGALPWGRSWSCPWGEPPLGSP